MDRMKLFSIAGWMGLVFISSGCAASAPQQATALGQRHDPVVDFNGNWSVEWCDRTNPELECGGFTATLVQQGDRVCGDYGGALVNMRQVDEGDIVGTVVGNVAVLAVESTRNGMIALVRAELRGDRLHWKEVDNISRGDTDIAIIATDDVLAPTPTEREDSPRKCSPPAGSSQER